MEVVVVVVSKVFFVFGEFVIVVFGYEVFGVDKLEFVFGCLFGEIMFGVVFYKLFGDIDIGRVSIYEDEVLFFERNVGKIYGINVVVK